MCRFGKYSRVSGHSTENVEFGISSGYGFVLSFSCLCMKTTQWRVRSLCIHSRHSNVQSPTSTFRFLNQRHLDVELWTLDLGSWTLDAMTQKLHGLTSAGTLGGTVSRNLICCFRRSA